MSGLVPGGIHTGNAADAAAKGGDAEQGSLRNAPEIIFCQELIVKHNPKAHGIY